MKKTLVVCLIMCSWMSTTFAQEVKDGPIISFVEEVHDYGEVIYNGDGHCEFEFTNTGNIPLIISRAQGTCGCTVPSWPEEPIAPGEAATIRVKYDTKRPGDFNKSVTIYSNAINNGAMVIRIKGKILPKPSSGTPVNSRGPSTN
ncbi:MAG: DUF1573 domain-containing protein [Crocinitomicaceae bacterium]|nr:DUF1573 domain-containing protein [Crocinitomicaceae bacterium]